MSKGNNNGAWLEASGRLAERKSQPIYLKNQRVGFIKTAEQQQLSVSNFPEEQSRGGLRGAVGAAGRARSIPEKLMPAGISTLPVEEKPDVNSL